jgi:hypothetical protein
VLLSKIGMKGVAVSDVMRAMMRLGFQDDEIYDVFVAMGLPAEEIEPLIERIKKEFEEAEIPALPLHVSREILQELQPILKEIEQTLLVKLESISLKLELLKNLVIRRCQLENAKQ